MVRANYDTLTLKLQDNLDHFDKYAEKANETVFFTQLVSVLCGHLLLLNLGALSISLYTKSVVVAIQWYLSQYIYRGQSLREVVLFSEVQCYSI